MRPAVHLQAAFARFGVEISRAEAETAVSHGEEQAVLVLLASREVAARFDAAHGRPPEDADIAALFEVFEALHAKG
ncbi:hypothetical protein MCEMSEM23_00094 [Rhabdaerophilaceae bacterium]